MGQAACLSVVPKTVPEFLNETDLVLGVGCSFTETGFGVSMPKGKAIIHATLDPMHLGKDLHPALGLVGDAGLVLQALIERLYSARSGTSGIAAAPLPPPMTATFLPR